MKRKTLLALTAVPLALLLSSCFTLQGFWIVANSIEAGGQATKATFQITPVRGSGDAAHQFFLIGVADSNDLQAGKGTWGTNHVFGGPYQLGVVGNLATIIGDQCSSNGFNLGDVTGMTFKGYVTPNVVNDKNKVNKDVLVQIGLKAVNGPGTEPVIGVTGMWIDDDVDGVVGAPDSEDAFLCSGVSQVFVDVTA